MLNGTTTSRILMMLNFRDLPAQPSPWCWSTCIRTTDSSQEASLPSSWQIHRPGGWSLVRSGQKRATAFLDQYWCPTRPGLLLLPGPPPAGHMGNSCAKPTPCLFSPPSKWSPCLVNFYFVAYLEAVKTDPGGPSAVIVPYLIIFPEPDY